MTPRSGARWAAATASVRGASHERTGMPNQDAVRDDRVDGRGRPVSSRRCADGHGGARYVRSDVGSRLGVEVACEVAATVLASLGASPDGRRIERDWPARSSTTIVDAWRERVLAHLAEHPVHRRRTATRRRAARGRPVHLLRRAR